MVATRLRVASFALLVVLAGATAGAEEFDRTVAVARGTRLELRLFGGTVVVRAWDRDAVRVRATHFRTDSINVSAENQVVRVGARSGQGLPHAIDFQIDAPSWMAVDLAGTYLDVTVEGTRADVVAQTVRGDVRVKGGAGTISLKSIEGEVVLEGASGRAELSSANNLVRVDGLHGNLFAETVSGSVKVRGVDGTSVEVGTTSGNISWDGTMAAGGRYQFVTHNGDVDVALDAQAGATLFVRIFEGSVRATFPLALPDEKARRKPFQVVVGSGAARVELETFSGVVSLRRPGADRRP